MDDPIESVMPQEGLDVRVRGEEPHLPGWATLFCCCVIVVGMTAKHWRLSHCPNGILTSFSRPLGPRAQTRAIRGYFPTSSRHRQARLSTGDKTMSSCGRFWFKSCASSKTINS